MGLCICLWIYLGVGPEFPAIPESPAQKTGVSGPCFFTAVCLLRCGTVWGSGGTPEMNRSLRPAGVSGPKDPESPAPVFLSSSASVWCGTGRGSGASPKGPRSLRPSRSFRPSVPEFSALPMIQHTGVSGHLYRRLRPEKAQRLVFGEGL